MAEHDSAHEHLDDTEAEVDTWQLPDVGASLAVPGTNVFGRKTPQYKPVEQPKKIQPPTLAEIEQIRAEAEQEGLSQGHAEGLQKGLEDGRLEGLKAGHEEGYAQGKEQGLEDGLAEAAAKMQQLNELLAQFEQPLKLLDVQVEQSLLSLVQTLAKQTLQHELNTHPDVILAALRAGIDALPIKEQRVSVRLHPEDVVLVAELYGEDQLAKNNWVLEKDPSLSRGSCIVDSQRSQVDMQLEQRIAAVFAGINDRQQQLASEEQQLSSPPRAAQVIDEAAAETDIEIDDSVAQAEDVAVEDDDDSSAPNPAAQ